MVAVFHRYLLYSFESKLDMLLYYVEDLKAWDMFWPWKQENMFTGVRQASSDIGMLFRLQKIFSHLSSHSASAAPTFWASFFFLDSPHSDSLRQDLIDRVILQDRGYPLRRVFVPDLFIAQGKELFWGQYLLCISVTNHMAQARSWHSIHAVFIRRNYSLIGI